MNTSFHCTWMNLRKKQHSHQEISLLGFRFSYFLWTYFIRSGNPPSYEVNDGLNCRMQYEEYGPGEWQALEKKLFSHDRKTQAKRKPLSSVIWAVAASASQICYLFLLNGIPICVCAAGHFGKNLEDSAANRCTMPRKGSAFAICC